MNPGSNHNDNDKSQHRQGDDGATTVTTKLTDDVVDVDEEGLVVAKAKVEDSGDAAAAAAAADPNAPGTFRILEDGTILGDPCAIPGLIQMTSSRQAEAVQQWGDRLNRLGRDERASEECYARAMAELAQILRGTRGVRARVPRAAPPVHGPGGDGLLRDHLWRSRNGRILNTKGRPHSTNPFWICGPEYRTYNKSQLRVVA
jgi:hypothetical protein